MSQIPPEGPSSLVPPQEGVIAWEDPSLPWLGRFFGTFASAFAPIRTLRAVSDGRALPALGFAVLSALPFMFAWGVVPFTHTLSFGPTFSITVNPKASPLPVWLDVVRASAVGAGISFAALLSWGLPFASMLRAFASSQLGASDARRAAARMVLYRGFLAPAGMTFFLAVIWAVPEQAAQSTAMLALVAFQLVPRMLILIHCQSLARYFGASALGSMAVAFVPLAVEWAVGLTVWRFAEQLLPKLP